MIEANKLCSKCDGVLVRGYVPDMCRANLVRICTWHDGIPKKSFWTGLKGVIPISIFPKRPFIWEHPRAPLSGGVPIAAFRCATCGFLEFYANDEYGEC
jgi:hypothetical protein